MDEVALERTATLDSTTDGRAAVEPSATESEDDDQEIVVVLKSKMNSSGASLNTMIVSAPSLPPLLPTRTDAITSLSTTQQYNSKNSSSPTPSNAVTSGDSPLLLILDDIIRGPIFEFVGVGYYRYVAGTNRRLHRLYRHFLEQHQERVSRSTAVPFFCYSYGTSGESIVQSLSCAELCRNEINEMTPDLRLRVRRGNEPEVLLSIENTIAYMAAVHGQLQVLQWVYVLLADSHNMNSCWTCRTAAANGHLEILQWARQREQPCHWDSEVCREAAANGKLQILQWACRNGCKWNQYTCISAAEHGHREVLQWARENGCPWNEQVCAYAARNGDLSMLQWAIENDCEWDEDVCRQAAGQGHLRVLQWARQNGCPWDSETCSMAALHGHLHVLQWAHLNGCDLNVDTCTNAAYNGHLEVLKWLHEYGCSACCDEVVVCGTAAANGHLEVLKWARQEAGYRWDSRTCLGAAKGGHLDVLIWARENGCDWNMTIYNAAIENGHYEVMQWARENGCIEYNDYVIDEYDP